MFLNRKNKWQKSTFLHFRYFLLLIEGKTLVSQGNVFWTNLQYYDDSVVYSAFHYFLRECLLTLSWALVCIILYWHFVLLLDVVRPFAHIFVGIVICYLTNINFAHSLLLSLKLSGILCCIYYLVGQHCTYVFYTIMLRHLKTWFRVITISAFFIFSMESNLRKF